MRVSISLARREGISLMEALIAVAIMTIGLLAIMSFFPLAAFQMGQAFKDERSTALAVNADQLFRTLWRYQNAASTPVLEDEEVRPAYAFGSTATALRQGPTLIDPIGHNTKTFNPTAQNWVAEKVNGIHRINLRLPFFTASKTYASSTKDSIRYTTLTDDIGFTANGVPDSSSGNAVDRGDRYNCSWLVSQPPGPYEPGRADLRVLVFEARPPSSDPVLEVYASTTPAVDNGSTSTTIDSGAFAMPGLKAGKWVMYVRETVQTSGTTTRTFVDVGFARCASATRGAGNSYQVDFDQPLVISPAIRGGTTTSYAVVFETLVEVFDRGTIDR